MPALDTTPKALKPFTFHGVSLRYDGGEQAVGDCPFCDKPKLYVNASTAQWDCKSCGVKGNAYGFLQHLHAQSFEATAPEDYDQLAHARKLMYANTLIEWRLAKSMLTGDWLVPGYNPEGALAQLYSYRPIPGSDKMRLMATPDAYSKDEQGVDHINHALSYAGWDPSKPEVAVCEGPWDAMALWEVMRYSREIDGGLAMTASESGSLLGMTNVVAVPGANVFKPVWGRLFAGKTVTTYYDNDHPRKHPKTGTMIMPTGLEGTRRAVKAMVEGEEKPGALFWLRWGEQGWDPNLPAGFDVRDYLTLGDGDILPDLKGRVQLLASLTARLAPIPEDWVPARTPGAVAKGSPEVEPLPCSDWKSVVTAFKRPMKWPEPGEGLDHALCTMLATVVSTLAVGDQLWVKVVGPASCGKSTLCEALAVAGKYVISKSTIRGFHSGYQTDRGGKEDHSLLNLCKDKTLVTKDGDTLLQSPNLGQILAEARDVYDRVSRTHYRNSMSRDYNDINMTWILCGTSSLRSLDSSELGERFLDCVIMDDIDDDAEDEILWRVANRSNRNMKFETKGKPEERDDPDMIKAKRLTAGYVEYLRKNALALFERVKPDEASLRRCMRLGKFIALFRARPSTRQTESTEREFGARLTSQMVRLMNCYAVVLNKTETDDEVMRRVRKVALDTARGKTLLIASYLYQAGEGGTDPKSLAILCNQQAKETEELLRFMRGIKVAESFLKPSPPGIRVVQPVRWRLTERVRRLWEEVMMEQPPHSINGEGEGV